MNKENKVLNGVIDKELDIQLILLKYLSNNELIVEVGLQGGKLEKSEGKDGDRSLKKEDIKDIDSWFKLVDRIEFVI